MKGHFEEGAGLYTRGRDIMPEQATKQGKNVPKTTKPTKPTPQENKPILYGPDGKPLN
jgi:hypothetical protein